ncbi:NAD-dependent epimerase/dehydratase family protein [Huintestinicola sp.]|uniref:NAD-dependent epimerase/dehydratase family protein n=1 Tax=Huintestinicola sp. TaxID=2981661 RepID=UPI003D7C5301
MRILVTGGTVFASRYTAEYFACKDYEVYVLNRGSRPQSEGIKLIKCDRHDLGNVLKHIEFDAVIDVTAYNENDISTLTDGLGSYGCYIMVSSSAVYPETNPQPFTEEQTCGVNVHWGDYGINKLMAEKLLLKKFPGAYIIRPPYLYGKMNNLYREAFVFECAEKGLPFYVPNDGKMPLQFFDIEDMCRFIEIIIHKKPIQHIFNVGNPQTVTVSEWVKLCCAAAGSRADIRNAPDNAEIRSYFPFRDYSYFLDVSNQLSLMPDVKVLEKGLAQSYEWYRHNKDLIIRKDYLEYIRKNRWNEAQL